jgi:2,6-dihydroxypseudooxynicotine hydrolase
LVVPKDARVASAIAHWAPRFVSNGVLFADFEEVTASIERWEDWCAAWSARAALHEALGKEALHAAFRLTAAEHLVRAAVYYHFAKFVFVHDPVQMRAAHMKAVACYAAALPFMKPRGERVEIPFEGKTLKGVLRGCGPVLVMAPGLDSTKEELHAYEEPFLARGIATLAIDGPGQGEAEYDVPICGDYERAASAVVDWIEKRPDLRSDLIAIWGVSLGGYYAPRAAAFEKRVKAAIANGGAFSVLENFDQRPQTLKDAYKLRTHSKSVEEAREKTRPFNLEGVASRITCPIFIIAGKEDRITRWQDAERVAKEVKGPCVFVNLEGGIHVGSNRGHLWRTQCADWMAEQLGLPKR